MSTFFSFIILLVGGLFSLFVFWELLREDYEEKNILSLSFFIFFGGLFGFLLIGWLFPKEGLLGAIFLSLVLGFLKSRRLQMKPIEVFEAGVPAFFIFLLFFLLATLTSGTYPLGQIGVEVLLIVGALFVFLIFRQNYRRFLWYPSGKVGFASLLTFAIYFLVRGGVAIFSSGVLFLWSGLTNVVVGLAFGLTSLVLLYFQSGREMKKWAK